MVNDNINNGTNTLRAVKDAIVNAIIAMSAAVVSAVNAIGSQVTFNERVALGLVDGATVWNKFGYNTDVDTAANEAIVEFGTAVPHLANGEILDISSTSANDDSGNTGVNTLVIFGVGGTSATDRNEITDVVVMDGTNTVNTNLYFWGINRMTIFNSGSADGNVGVITAQTSGGTVMATMPAGQGTTQQAVLYIPEGYQFNADWLWGEIVKSSGGGSPKGSILGYVFSEVVDSQFEIFRKTLDTTVNTSFELNPKQPFTVGEKSILWFDGQADQNNTEFRCRFSGIMYDLSKFS